MDPVAAAPHSLNMIRALRCLKVVPAINLIRSRQTLLGAQQFVIPSSAAASIRLASSNTSNSPADNLEKIYYGTLTPKIQAVKVFSLTTSVVGLAVQPMLMEQGAKLGGTPMVVFMCGFAGFFTFVTPLILHFVTKKYVTEIHYDAGSQEYTATTISFLLTKKQVGLLIVFFLHFLLIFFVCKYRPNLKFLTFMCPMWPACLQRLKFANRHYSLMCPSSPIPAIM